MDMDIMKFRLINYDTDLNITWLQDWQLPKTTEYSFALPSDGKLDWNGAKFWAENLTFAGYSDWRLPTADIRCGWGRCHTNEISHIWIVELGNRPSQYVTSGPLKNVDWSISGYWTGSDFSSNAADPDQRYAWGADIYSDFQLTFYAGGYRSVVAVRDGDSLPIPELSTSALLLIGLLLFVRKLVPINSQYKAK
jgi:hypothetical protein